MAVLLLAAFSLFFKYSLTGMAMRATADNQQVALSLGISVKGIFALSWCIATVVSTLGRHYSRECARRGGFFAGRLGS